MIKFVENKYLIRIFLDISLLLLSGAAYIIVNNFLQTTERGFFCDDQSLKYPLKGSTCGFKLLCVISIGIPLGVLVLSEIFRNQSSIRAILTGILEVIVPFSQGFLSHNLLVIVMKKLVGRLRPNFYGICQPVLLSQMECSNNAYVNEYVCSNEDTTFINEINSSFPSGHASFIFFGMTFLVIYFEDRLNFKWSILIKSTCQLICILLAFVISVGRITENWHHWTDVLAGGIIGILFASWSAFLGLKSNKYSS